jgi:hypothetical protein
MTYVWRSFPARKRGRVWSGRRTAAEKRKHLLRVQRDMRSETPLNNSEIVIRESRRTVQYKTDRSKLVRREVCSNGESVRSPA